MREIKFRVWNNNTNKYEYTELDYYFVIDQRIKNYEYEQYTGLKDKNGKEIYEGDIVDKEYDNLAIFDKNGVVGMGYLYDSDGYNNGTIYGWKAGDSSLADVCGECEVIGNIHENPELLGRKK